MLEDLDAIDWENLESCDDGCLTAYEPATEIPNYLRQLLSSDPKERSYALGRLYENLLHQGTQFGETHYVIPFIIELCGDPSVPNRASLLYFWSHAITGYFNIRERPTWGDGKILYRNGEVDHWAMKHGDFQGLNQIYRKSLKGKDLLYKLLNDDEPSLRGVAVSVIAAMPTIAKTSVPKLKARFRQEEINWIRGRIAFALGEFGASTTLEQILTSDECLAVRCIAACQLA